MELIQKVFTPSTNSAFTWLDHIFENSVAGVFILDSEGDFLKTNRFFEQLTGYSRDELLRMSILDLTRPDEQLLTLERLQSLKDGRLDSFKFEKLLLTRSGELRWVEINCTAVRQDKTYALCFLSDIHQKKTAHEQLRISEEQLHQAQQVALLGSWGLELNTGRITWSRGMYDILELPYDYEPALTTLANHIHPEDRALFTEKFIHAREEITNLELRHLTPSGVKHFLLNSRLEIEDGIPVRYHGTSLDISDHVLMERRLELVQKTAKLGWWEWNLLSDNEDLWSDSMFELLELDKTKTRRCFDSYLNTLHPEDLQKTLLVMKDPELLRNGWHNRESRHRKGDGTYKHMLTSGHFVWDGDRPVKLIGTIMDISQTREMQIRLQEAQKIARLGWWEVDLSTGETEWSDAIYEIMGRKKSQGALTFQEYCKNVHPEDLHWITQDPKNFGEGWTNKILRYKRKSGGYIHVLSSGRVIHNDGKPIRIIGTNMDISALKETQIKLEQAQRVAKLGWWEADLSGTGNHSFPKEFLEIFEIREGEITCFQDFIRYVHPDDVSLVTETYRTALETGGWKDLVHRIRKQTGDYKHITSNATIEFQDGKPFRLFGSLYDISAAREIQLKLEQAQRIAKLGWWEYDLTGSGNHWYSPEQMEIFEISSEEEMASDEDFFDLVHPDDRLTVKENYQNAFETKGWTNLVHRIRRKDGGYKYISSNATLEFDGNHPVRLFGSVYDITYQKEIELELAKNLVNLAAMVNSMENMVFILDDQLIFREIFCHNPVSVSLNLMDLKEKRLEEMLYKFDLKQKLPPENFTRALEGRTVAPVTYEYGPEGQKRWWEAKFNTFEGQEGKQWLVLVINDVTSRKTAEEELMKQAQKEKELSEMRTQFVSMASHQFRTPLTVIKSNMQLLELTGIEHPVVRKVTRRLGSEVDRLVSLMEDIMTMGSAQSNAVRAHFNPISVTSLMKQVKLKVESQQVDGRTMDLRVKGSEQLLQLDGEFMEHALVNLVENAFKYSPEAPNPEAVLSYESDKLRISITDYGIGILPEDQPKLFTSFHRGSNVKHIQGTGLGLAVTREFIRLNQGTVFLNTNRKSGTEFCVDLPINQ